MLTAIEMDGQQYTVWPVASGWLDGHSGEEVTAMGRGFTVNNSLCCFNDNMGSMTILSYDMFMLHK